MDSIEYNREIAGFIQQRLEVFDCLLLTQIQSELFLDLLMDVAMSDIGDIRINHESNEVEDQVSTLAKNSECRETERFETGVVCGGRSTHAIDHFFANFNGRREGFRISSEDIAKVNMEEMPCCNRNQE